MLDYLYGHDAVQAALPEIEAAVMAGELPAAAAAETTAAPDFPALNPPLDAQYESSIRLNLAALATSLDSRYITARTVIPRKTMENKRKRMIVTTTPIIEGRPVESYLGIVTGEAIMGANMFKDMFAGIRDIVGGPLRRLRRRTAPSQRHRHGRDDAKRERRRRGRDSGRRSGL